MMSSRQHNANIAKFAFLNVQYIGQLVDMLKRWLRESTRCTFTGFNGANLMHQHMAADVAEATA